MSEKITVVALGHRALGTTLPEQKIATKKTAKAIADLVELESMTRIRTTLETSRKLLQKKQQKQSQTLLKQETVW